MGNATKYLELIVGLLLVLVGACLIYVWRYPLIIVIMGCIGLVLLLIGLLMMLLGYSEIKDAAEMKKFEAEIATEPETKE